MQIHPVVSHGRKGLAAAFLAICFTFAAAPIQAQQPPSLPPPDQLLAPNQLDDLVAPVALYPDELVSQLLVAATYPLEVVEAFQWQQKSPGLTGPALTQAAEQQNWDPSVQALVLFPDVLKRLNDDVTWTTDLGNAFLAQQQDVMDAVQRMRQRAQQAGRLQSTPELNVVQSNDNGQPYIGLEPTDPDVIYVPVYDPEWIWGPPLYYPYPHWYWPPRSFLRGGRYWGYGSGINIGIFFGGGWRGWDDWGWHPRWGNRSVIVNDTFVHQYNFNGSHLNNAHGTSVWSHDPGHRAGVPYAAPAVQNQFRGNVRQNVMPRATPQPRSPTQSNPAQGSPAQTNERFGNRMVPQNQPALQQNRTVFGGQDSGAAATRNAEHGNSSLGPARTAPQPRPQPMQQQPRQQPMQQQRSAPPQQPQGGARRR